jgi:hypothetical protein
VLFQAFRHVEAITTPSSKVTAVYGSTEMYGGAEIFKKNYGVRGRPEICVG